MVATANIVNLRTVNIQDWLKDPQNVYVGRGSKYGNPFKLKNYNRATAVALYKSYILAHKELEKSAIELSGKRLGCWCAPYQCHAEFLHLLAGNQPVYQGKTVMVTKPQLDDSLGTLKTELATQLKEEIKAVVDQSISALRENVINRLLEENKQLKEKVLSLEKTFVLSPLP